MVMLPWQICLTTPEVEILRQNVISVQCVRSTSWTIQDHRVLQTYPQWIEKIDLRRKRWPAFAVAPLSWISAMSSRAMADYASWAVPRISPGFHQDFTIESLHQLLSDLVFWIVSTYWQRFRSRISEKKNLHPCKITCEVKHTFGLP